MIDDLYTLRARIKEIGVAEVARMARVPATTLYSFCQNPDRELAFSTVIAVGQVLENLRARDQRAAAIQHGLQPDGVYGIPVVSQAGSSEIFLEGIHRREHATRRWFDEAWLRGLARDGVHHLAIVTVTKTGLSPILQVGDQALVSDARSLTMFRQPGVFLALEGDRLGFVQSEQAEGKTTRPKYTYTASSKSNAPALAASSLQIVAKVLWIGRSLASAGQPLGASPGTAPKRRRTTKRPAQR